MFDGRFRSGVDRVTKPVAGALKSTGLSPDHLTLLGLVMAVPAAWAIATGRLGLGLGLMIASALPDLLDGALAKASGRASIRGAFFDSVADRVTDTLYLGALTWYLADSHRGHIFMLPVALLGVSLLISYERAKAESLGFEAKGGLMERAERVVVLCAAVAFSVAMIPLLWLMFVLTGLTAIQRFVKVWNQANAAGHRPPPPERRVFTKRVARGDYEPMSVRWRSWWDSGPDRYGDKIRPGSAAGRWQQRRRARRYRTADRSRTSGSSRRP